MSNFLNFLVVNFNNFYNELNNVGKLVFFIAVILLLILIVLIIIMFIQKTIIERQIKALQDDEKEIDIQKKSNNVDIEVDMNNEKTRDLKYIVEELKKANSNNKDTTDIYEDEQEKTAIISYKELLKVASNEDNVEPTIKKIKINEMIEDKPKRQEIFSSVFTPNQIPVYKKNKREINLIYSDNESFLNSLKEFRNNL